MTNQEASSSACGIYDCDTCEHLGSKECFGCREGNDLLKANSQGVCAVYACVQSHAFASCADCTEDLCGLRRCAETLCPIRSRFENKRWWAGRMSRALAARGQTVPGKEKKVSEKVVNRLRWYLAVLEGFAKEERQSVSSWQIAEKVGVNAALVRKDLARFGDFGTPSLGYGVNSLCGKIREILGLGRPHGIVWIGARCFRLHESSVDVLSGHSCPVLAVFDTDPNEVGATIGGKVVLAVDQLDGYLAGVSVDTAVIAIPSGEAQAIADVLAARSVKAVLNLSGGLIVLPDRVKVSSFDIVGELLELCFYC